MQIKPFRQPVEDPPAHHESEDRDRNRACEHVRRREDASVDRVPCEFEQLRQRVRSNNAVILSSSHNFLLRAIVAYAVPFFPLIFIRHYNNALRLSIQREPI